MTGPLPHGAALRPLEPHDDERGTFTELFRAEWLAGISAPVQWNAVRTEPGVLRGVHVHPRHDDYLVVCSGRATVGLADLRPDAPTAGLAMCVELCAQAPAALTIPHGVAHGFYFHEPSLHVYAVSHYWDPADELGCHWQDPALGIPWPQASARLSPRDAALPTLDALRGQLGAALLPG
ncbi:MAG: dTDP-4-dehydrorhamnose 3,5-epimerase [Solirubrobacteraceae bacterium]